MYKLMQIALLVPGPCGFAHPTLDRNCVSCHPSSQNRFELLNFQKTLSNLRVYTVTQGSTFSINVNITNGSNQHATSFYILNSSGKTNSANKLTYQPDPAWVVRNTGGLHYMLPASGSASTVAKEQLVLNLAVDPTVAPDLYRGTIQVAGLSGTFGWGQQIDFFIEVVSVPQGLMILNPAFANGQFECPVLTATGTTYFLEYKSSLNDNTWTAIGAPLTGNGTNQILVDPAPSGPARFYRLRVQP
jgi:hypothetical protein